MNTHFTLSIFALFLLTSAELARSTALLSPAKSSYGDTSPRGLALLANARTDTVKTDTVRTDTVQADKAQTGNTRIGDARIPLSGILPLKLPLPKIAPTILTLNPLASTALVNLFTVTLREEYLVEQMLEERRSVQTSQNTSTSEKTELIDQAKWLRAGLAAHIRYLTRLHGSRDDQLRVKLLAQSTAHLPSTRSADTTSNRNFEIDWRIALLDKTKTDWRLLPLPQNAAASNLNQFYSQPNKAADLGYFIERSHLAINDCPSQSAIAIDSLLSRTADPSPSDEQALVCAIRAQAVAFTILVNRPIAASRLMKLYAALSQQGSPFLNHLGIQAELASALVEVGNYPEALRLLYRLQSDTDQLRLVYNTVQRIFAMVQRGDGSVVLQNP